MIPLPPSKKNKYININKTKTKTKTDAKNQVGKTVPKVQIGQTSSLITIDLKSGKENNLSFSLITIRFFVSGAVWRMTRPYLAILNLGFVLLHSTIQRKIVIDLWKWLATQVKRRQTKLSNELHRLFSFIGI